VDGKATTGLKGYNMVAVINGFTSGLRSKFCEDPPFTAIKSGKSAFKRLGQPIRIAVFRLKSGLLFAP